MVDEYEIANRHPNILPPLLQASEVIMPTPTVCKIRRVSAFNDSV